VDNSNLEMFNFNQPLSRAGTHAEKYKLRKTLFGRDDVRPMWVADMDLPTPPFVLNALRTRLNHPVLGYSISPDALYQAIIGWQAQYGLEVKAEQILFTHNVANGFFMAVQAFSQADEAVLVQPPVYPPFLSAPALNDRKLVEAPLSLENGRYQIDFEAFEQAITENKVKAFLFCNPQNPSGRVWRRDELQQIVDICYKHGVTIVADEIHADLVYPPLQHTPIASLSEKAQQITVTLSSPGKTFNLGGLQIGYAIFQNPKLKAAYLKVCKANSIDGLNLFAQVALTAAYTEQGKQWRDELLNHFSDNITALENFFAREFPEVKVMRPEAGYLVWLDFRQLFSTHQLLKDWLINDAKLGLNDGQSFAGNSDTGTGFMRMNLAVSKQTLNQAIQQLTRAKSALNKQA